MFKKARSNRFDAGNNVQTCVQRREGRKERREDGGSWEGGRGRELDEQNWLKPPAEERGA